MKLEEAEEEARVGRYYVLVRQVWVGRGGGKL
jgi:hypothetical protein